MKSEHQQRVEEFMKKAGQEVPDRITMPDEKTRKLRAELIMEEALETVEALGFNASVSRGAYGRFLCVDKPFGSKPDLHQIIDGCCDLSVVLQGCLLACGVPDEPFLECVDQHNLAKFGPGGYRREDGKWIKPPDLKPPNIRQVECEVNQTRKEMKNERESS